MNDRIITFLSDELGAGFERIRLSECQLMLRSKKLKFDFIMPCDEFDSYYNNDIQAKMLDIIKKHCGSGFDIAFSVKKVYSDVHIVRNAIYNYLSEKHQIAANELTAKNFIVEGQTPTYNIEIKLPSHLYTYLSNSKFEIEVKNHLEKNFCDDFEIVLTEDRSLNTASALELATDNEKIYKPKTVGIQTSRVLLGSEINQQPQRISNIKGDKQRVTICGKISFFAKKTSKAGKLYYKFTLTDPTGNVEVLYFPRGKSPEQIETLVLDGDEILMQGDLSESEYGKSVFLRDMMRCTIDWDSVEGISLKDVPNFYKFIEPTPCETAEQENIFDTKDTADFLKGKSFVVFDLETTGKDPNVCKVIEIAAIKIVDGKWTEQFTTFCNPGEKLTREIIDLTSITDKDLEGKPNFAEVLPDFLKFCKDCILVAHNQEYDVRIVSRYARENSYKFLNASMCTLEMSRKYLTMNTRHRLQDVAEYYGVKNIHAHRAIGDVEVTAKVFAELVRFLG